MASTLLGLSLLLLLLAAAGGIAHRLGTSAVPVYILLGVGTRAVVVEPELFHYAQAVGIALLLFFVGLEFSILRLRTGAARYARAGSIDLALNFPVGVVGGLLLGWGLPAALVLGAALYISSSAIVATNVTELGRAGYPETEFALAILVAEDLFIALFLAALALWVPLGEDPASPLLTAGVVVGLAVLLGVLADPLTRAVDRIVAEVGDEAFLLFLLGSLLLFSGGTLLAGLSEGVGAFAAGLLVGNSVHKERVETLLSPFLGLFTALFFFAFGLMIQADQLLPALVPGLLLAAAAVGSKLLTGLAVGRDAGLSVASSVSLGMTLTPRGEFSVLLAGYAMAVGAPSLRAVVAVVVLVLALLAGTLTRHGPAIGKGVERRLARESAA